MLHVGGLAACPLEFCSEAEDEIAKPYTPAESLFFQGTDRLVAGDTEGAESAFRAALQLERDFAEAHANLGLLLDQQERWTEGEEHYRNALRLSPRQTQTYLNFGAMLMKQKRHSEADAAFRKALTLAPDSPAAWSSRGVLLACIKEEAAAEYCYRSAMVIAPDYRKAGFNLAYLLLRQGRYQEGWTRLEARDWYPPLEERLMFPRWQGETLKGKSLMIGFEAGHGDMIQFCRYATQVKRLGASRVSILCQPGLTSLFTRLSGVDETISLDGPWPSTGFDYWTPALSLPLRFGTTLDTIPTKLPYLSAEPERIRYWADVIGPAGLRVGLVWKGNPRFENDLDRSLPSLQTLSPLNEVEGVRYFSLQKTTCAEAAEGDSELPWMVNLGARIGDFSDTAAIVMNLDLVITVDTAVAHLAGALAKPCWVLLPDYKTDWRWLTDREDSPWYPGVMRLFRQSQARNWATVVDQVCLALRILAANRSDK